MKEADIPLVSASQCQSIWGSVIAITNRIQCVGGDGRISVCSVSPLKMRYFQPLGGVENFRKEKIDYHNVM